MRIIGRRVPAQYPPWRNVGFGSKTPPGGRFCPPRNGDRPLSCRRRKESRRADPIFGKGAPQRQNALKSKEDANVSLAGLWRFLGFFDGPTKISGQNGPISAKTAGARDYMAFNWQHPIFSERAYFSRPNGSAWAHAFGIKVLPFLAETSR
jgi:hypothetical protein